MSEGTKAKIKGTAKTRKNNAMETTVRKDLYDIVR